MDSHIILATGILLLATEALATPSGPPASPAPLQGASGSIGGGALLVGNCASGTVSILGATTAMRITATPVTYPGAGFDWGRAYVSSAGTVTVQVCADVAGTPTASVYNVLAQ